MILSTNRMRYVLFVLAVWSLTAAPDALQAQASRAPVPIDPRLYGTWIDGRQTHVFTTSNSDMAQYSVRPLGQKTSTYDLSPTDTDRVYKLRTRSTGSSGVFLAFSFIDNGKGVQVNRFEGKKYVPYGTWKRRVTDPRRGTAARSSQGL